MSYDISLKDATTGDTIELPVKHIMTGGTYRAEYTGGEFVPTPISDAWLNITYNYGSYYYEATEGDERFAHDEVSAYYSDGTQGPIRTEYGIRGIYGKTGAESIPMLKDMVVRIEAKYKKDGEWISTERERTRYVEIATGKELDFFTDILNKGMSEDLYKEETYTEMVNEGPDTDYWEATAGNAIRPLYQLIAIASLRPDGVWEGD